MSKLKIEHVNQAYQRIRISGLTVEAFPEETEIALVVQEDMMNEFRSRNICSSYVFEEIPDPNTDSGVDSAYNNAMSANLAIRLLDYFGKRVPETLMRQATQALSNWSARSGKTNMISAPRRQPKGSGNTFRFQNWLRYYRFEDDAPISCNTMELKVGETDSFSVSFAPYLLDSETIVSFTLDASKGVTIVSSAISTDSESIILECKGECAGNNPVVITITTSTPRINPETVYFNVTNT